MGKKLTPEDLDHAREAMTAECEVLSKKLYDLITSQPATGVGQLIAAAALAQTVGMVIGSSGEMRVTTAGYFMLNLAKYLAVDGSLE